MIVNKYRFIPVFFYRINLNEGDKYTNLLLRVTGIMHKLLQKNFIGDKNIEIIIFFEYPQTTG